MGKMLDSLVRNLHPHKHRRPCIQPPHQESAPQIEVAACPTEVTASFIEVGAPGRRIEASADVMAAPAKRSFQSPQTSTQSAPVEFTAMAVPALLESSAPVTLEAWPTSPNLSVPAEVITYHQPEHPATREYAKLLARLRTEGTNQQCALLCGLTPDADAALLALNLAFHGTKNADLQMIVVDASACPVLQRFTEKGAGLLDVIAGQAALTEALQPSPRDNLHMLSIEPNGELSAEALQWVFSWLRQRYAWICVVAATAESACPTIIRRCDVVYPICAANHNGEIAPLVNNLVAKGARIGGIIKWNVPRF